MLLVEDDPPLRRLVRRMFENGGFEVIEARNGREALDMAKATESHIDLLVTDVAMPQMDGFDLTVRFSRLHPEAKVLLLSGRATTSVAVRGGLKELGRPYLLKPFTQQALEAKVAEILDPS